MTRTPIGHKGHTLGLVSRLQYSSCRLHTVPFAKLVRVAVNFSHLFLKMSGISVGPSLTGQTTFFFYIGAGKEKRKNIKEKIHTPILKKKSGLASETR